MNLGIVLRLLARPSFAIAAGIMLSLIAAMVLAERAMRDPAYAEIHAHFPLVFHAIAFGLLVSFGGFLGRAIAELEGMRIGRTLPGLQRRIATGLAMMALAVAGAALGFLYFAIPGEFQAVPALALGFLNVFLFCLGLGLGWSWLLFVVLALLGSRLHTLVGHFHSAPLASGIVALGGACLLFALRQGRFALSDRDAESLPLRLFSRFGSPFSVASIRRRATALPDGGAIWPGVSPATARPNLIKAGAFERLGQRRGGLWTKTLFAMAITYGIFGSFLIGLARMHREMGLLDFAARLFAGAPTDPWQVIARMLFAACSGVVGFVCAVTLDTSLRPDVWHPISRRRRGRAVFCSHLRQNIIFLVFHLSVAFMLVAGLGLVAGTSPSAAAFRAFLMPSALGFLLAPIPQALFPNGAEIFRTKVDALLQLGAGLVGGAFCLLTVYWTAYWPARGLQHSLSPAMQAALFAVAGVAIYGSYYGYLNFRYARTDLSRRAL